MNEVLLRVLDEIEDQTDISEEESIRLNRLCKMLHELESLFEGSEVSDPSTYRRPSINLTLFPSQTSVGREVPIWFKFVFLSELLEASMVCALSCLYRVLRCANFVNVLSLRLISSSSSIMAISSISRLKRLSDLSAHSSLTRLCGIETSRRFSRDTLPSHPRRKMTSLHLSDTPIHFVYVL